MKLEQILANPDGNLPFATSVHEERVLECCLEMSPEELKSHSDMIKQWITFNKGLNEYECDEYQTWVAQIYSKIINLIDSLDSKLREQKSV